MTEFIIVLDLCADRKSLVDALVYFFKKKEKIIRRGFPLPWIGYLTKILRELSVF